MLSEAEVTTLFHEGLAKRRGMAFFRLGVVAAICFVLMGISAAIGGAFFCIAVPVCLTVLVAFIIEAVRNLSGALVFVVGRVTESAWVMDSDEGRLVKVPRVKVDVEECFERLRNGTKKEATGVVRPFVIELPQWLERVKVDQRVAFVCLPASTDPVHWKVLT